MAETITVRFMQVARDAQHETKHLTLDMQLQAAELPQTNDEIDFSETDETNPGLLFRVAEVTRRFSSGRCTRVTIRLWHLSHSFHPDLDSQINLTPLAAEEYQELGWQEYQPKLAASV